MAGSMSDYLEKKLQNHVLGQGSFTPSSVLYVGLWTDSNTDTQHDAGTYTEAWPGNWTNYARIPVSANGVFFSASGTTAYVSNLSALSWPQVNAAGATSPGSARACRQRRTRKCARACGCWATRRGR